MKQVLLFIIASMIPVCFLATDYCKISCYSDPSYPHTKCRNYKPRSRCKGKRLDNVVTAADRKMILDLHNFLRSRVASGNEKRGAPGPQPPAKHMPMLVWDDEVAMIAQEHAEDCPGDSRYPHDVCRDVIDYQSGDQLPVGQNVGWVQIQTTAPRVDKNWTDPLHGFYEEVMFLPNDYVRRFRPNVPSGEKIGHYTAMMWAGVTRIGCGYVKYEVGSTIERPFGRMTTTAFHYVCNYRGGKRNGANTYHLPIYEVYSGDNPPIQQLPVPENYTVNTQGSAANRVKVKPVLWHLMTGVLAAIMLMQAVEPACLLEATFLCAISG